MMDLELITWETDYKGVIFAHYRKADRPDKALCQKPLRGRVVLPAPQGMQICWRCDVAAANPVQVPRAVTLRRTAVSSAELKLLTRAFIRLETRRFLERGGVIEYIKGPVHEPGAHDHSYEDPFGGFNVALY
jgi:hypothetical protein